jgi:hypothetical protein
LRKKHYDLLYKIRYQGLAKNRLTYAGRQEKCTDVQISAWEFFFNLPVDQRTHKAQHNKAKVIHLLKAIEFDSKH